MSHRHPIAIALAAAALFALAGCADRSDPGTAPDDSAGHTAEPVTSTASTPRDRPSSKKDADAPKGDCDLLTAAEISAAFGGKLSVRRAGGHGGRGGACTWSLAEVAESELILQAGDEASYDARKASYGNSGIAVEPLALGKEAMLFNKAQVIALREDGQSLSLGLQLFVFNAPMPVTEDEARKGLEALAGTALERL